MLSEIFQPFACYLNSNGWGTAADGRVIEPHRSGTGLTVPRGTQIEADSADRTCAFIGTAEQAGGPEFDIGHMNQGERGLVLIRTAAGASVIRGVEDSVGYNEIGCATGFESPEATDAGGVLQIVVAGCPVAEGQKVFRGDDRVAAFAANDPPGFIDSGDRIEDRLIGTVE